MLQLILARALQGIGGGGLMALAFTIVGDILPPRQRGRYMGYFSGVFAFAGVAGPVIGGFFVDHSSWRGAFWINLPLGVIALAVVSANLKLPKRTTNRRIDYLGALLLVSAVSCLMLLSVWGGKQYQWVSPQILGLSVATVALSGLFVARERTAPEPLLPLRLFSNKIVRLSVLIGFLISCCMFTSTIFLPLFLQAVAGVSATNSGLLIAPTMAGVTISSLVAGRRMTATGRYKRYLMVGIVLAAATVGGLSLLRATTPVAVVGLLMFALGLGMGAVFPILNMASQNSVDFADIGTATSTVRFSQSLGGTLAVTMAGAVLAARFRSGLGSLAQGVDVDKFASSPAQIRALAEPLHGAVLNSLAHAVAFVFLIVFPLILIAVVLSTRLPEIPLRDTITTVTASPEAAPASALPGPPEVPVVPAALH
jgi:EmrB/QacA subfamily drug resistance transporter